MIMGSIGERFGFLFVGLILAWAVGMMAAGSGCAGPRASVPTAAELSAEGAILKGMDIDAIRRGRVIFVTECGACHRLYLPEEYSPGEWRPIAKRMAERASLGTDQAVDLEAYLAAASLTAWKKR